MSFPVQIPKGLDRQSEAYHINAEEDEEEEVPIGGVWWEAYADDHTETHGGLLSPFVSVGEITHSPPHEEDATTTTATMETLHQLFKKPKKKKNTYMHFFEFAVVAALLLLLSRLGLKALGPKGLKLKEALLLDEEVRLLHGELNTCMDALKSRWQTSSNRVKRAFVQNYLPNLEEKEITIEGALQVYVHHVEGIRTALVPAIEREEERKNYIRNLKLIIGIIEAASLRLEGLTRLEIFQEKEKTEMAVLGIQDPSPLFSLEGLEDSTEDAMSFQDFMNELPKQLVPPNVAEAEGKRLSRSFLQKVISLLKVEEEAQREDNRIIQLFLNRVLEAKEERLQLVEKEDYLHLSPFQIVSDNKQQAFNAAEFGEYLYHRKNQASNAIVCERLMTYCANRFTLDGMNRVLTKLTEYHREIPMRKKTQKQKAIQRTTDDFRQLKNHDLLSLAIFLI
ncbi:hypothetical protein Emed_000660 [Eimeria media]